MRYGTRLWILTVALTFIWSSASVRCDSFKMEPSHGYIGTEVHLSGHSETVKSATISVYWPSLIPSHPAAVIAGLFSNASGDFSGSFSVPFGFENGSYTVELRSGSWTVGNARFTIGAPEGGYSIPPEINPPSRWEPYQDCSSGIRDIRMLSEDLGFSIGYDGSVNQYNGFAWIHQAQITPGDELRCLEMISPTDGWIGGTGRATVAFQWIELDPGRANHAGSHRWAVCCQFIKCMGYLRTNQ